MEYVCQVSNLLTTIGNLVWKVLLGGLIIVSYIHVDKLLYILMNQHYVLRGMLSHFMRIIIFTNLLRTKLDSFVVFSQRLIMNL